MARKRRPPEPLDTIWEVSDDLWARIAPILAADWQPSPKGGRPPSSWRPILNTIIHRLRSSCQWNHLPENCSDDSTTHRWFQRWCQRGVFQQIWAVLVSECAELNGVHWDWQSADGAMGKARFGGGKGGQEPDQSRQGRHQKERAGR